MERVSVEAFEDRSRPGDGHVVLLLRGIAKAPDRTVLRLRPVETAAGDAASRPWLKQDCEPVSSRLTPQGLELVLGPDVTELGELMPGTIVEIEVPAVHARGELLWPAITPVSRPKRKSVLLRRAQRDQVAELDPAEPEGRLAAAAEPPGQADEAFKPPPAVTPAAPPVAIPTATRAPKEATTMATSAEPNKTVPRDATSPSPAEPSNAGKSDRNDYVTFYPNARGGRLAAPAAGADGATTVRPSLLPQSRGAFAAMIIGAMLASQAALLLLTGANPFGSAGTARTIEAPPPAPAGAASASLAAQRDTSIFELLAAPATSPRGASAKDVTAAKALENAQALLTAAPGKRDTEEGAFWLRRYIAATVGDERARRALTQLGSAFAEPTGRPADYVKARQAWELAAAFGDPVAMCFVGTLFEYGLGVEADKPVAG